MKSEKPPTTPEDNSDDIRKKRMEIVAAFKCGRELPDDADVFVIDHQEILEDDDDLLSALASKRPYALGHMDKWVSGRDVVGRNLGGTFEKNKEEARRFIIKWLGSLDNPEDVTKVYRDARMNALRVNISVEELDKIREIITKRNEKEKHRNKK